MAGRLRVLRAGPGHTIQDAGRFGYLRFGVTPAGPMDWQAFRTVHLVLGNDPGKAAAIEVSLGGIDLVCEEEALWIAFAGGDFIWRRGAQACGAAALLRLAPGDVLTARPGAAGAFAYLSVEGGLATPMILGSRATHTRSAIGGIDGRMLQPGDVLPRDIAAANSAGVYTEARIDAPWLARDTSALLVVPGPQDDYFTTAAMETFFSAEFRLTVNADRMAYRFTGPAIAHRKGFNIVTDGVALGAIQVGGDRQPMILMADRQPTGGYPKIGHVARVDISRLAQLRPGEACRFAPATAEEARQALLTREDAILRSRDHLRPLTRLPSSEELLSLNLVGGVTGGDDADEEA